MIGSSTLTRLGDVYGRKPIYLLGMVLHMCVSAAIVFVSNGMVCMLLLLVFGLSIASRYYVGYTYNVEVQPKSHYILVSTCMFLMESVVYFFCCCFFWKLSTDWHLLMIPNLVFMVLGLLTISWWPETPRYLVSSGQFTNARKSFAWIGRFNGLDDETIQQRLSEITFEKEIDDRGYSIISRIVKDETQDSVRNGGSIADNEPSRSMIKRKAQSNYVERSEFQALQENKRKSMGIIIEEDDTSQHPLKKTTTKHHIMDRNGSVAGFSFNYNLPQRESILKSSMKSKLTEGSIKGSMTTLNKQGTLVASGGPMSVNIKTKTKDDQLIV